jgi:hypothetical protein
MRARRGRSVIEVGGCRRHGREEVYAASEAAGGLLKKKLQLSQPFYVTVYGGDTPPFQSLRHLVHMDHKARAPHFGGSLPPPPQ